ncbi:MAG: diaminopimelate decarboxylase [Fimbriimonadales bacterium]
MFSRFLGSQCASSEGKLVFGDISARRLVEEYGTPLYVMDAADLRGKMREFKAAAPGCKVSYGSKAASALAILQVAREEGLDVDVASLGELEAALRAGFEPKQITFHGNNKTDAELEAGTRLGVGAVVLDHLSEIRRLAGLGTPQRVMIRLAPGVDPDTHKAISTGQEDSKFGFNIADGRAEDAVDEVLKHRCLRFIGYHVHVGSQLMTSESHVAAVRRAAAFAVAMNSKTGEVDEICAGGGLGVRYLPSDEPELFAEHCRSVIAAVTDGFGGRPPLISFEPGRALVAEAGTTLYRVGAMKKIDSRTYISVDGGVADNPRPQLYGATYTAMNADRLEEPHDFPFRVSGRHCETDTLISEALLPASTGEGDVIAVQCTGAYNHAMASNYNRYPRPAMVIVGDGDTFEAVRRETVDDLFRTESVRP